MCCVPTARRLASTKLNYASLVNRVQRDVGNAEYSCDNSNEGKRAASSNDSNNEFVDTVPSYNSNKSIPYSSYLFRKRESWEQQQQEANGQLSTVDVLAPEPAAEEDFADAKEAAPAASTAAPKKRRKRIRKKLKPGLTAKNQERQFVKHNYHDHGNDDPEEYLRLEILQQESAQEHDAKNGKHSHTHQPKLCGGPGNSGGVSVPFPFKLHTLLEQIELDGYANIISWQPHGRSFVIHDKKTFVAEIMPKYFKQTKLTSFQRQLNLYGFTRLSRGTDAGGYYHELFLRNMPFLCHKMIRIKCKGTGFKAASDPDAEPNFYTMPYVCHAKNYWKDSVAKLEAKLKTEDADSSQGGNIVSCNGSLKDHKRASSPYSSEEDDLYAAFLRTQEKKRHSLPPPQAPLVCHNYQAPSPVVNRQKYAEPYPVEPSNAGPIFSSRDVPMIIDCLLAEDDSSTSWQEYPLPMQKEEDPWSIERVPTFDAHVSQPHPPALDYSSVLAPVPLMNTMSSQSVPTASSFEYDWVGFGVNQEHKDVNADYNSASWMSNPASMSFLRSPMMPSAVLQPETSFSGEDDDDEIFNKILVGASDMMSELNEKPLNDDEDLGHFLEMLVE